MRPIQGGAAVDLTSGLLISPGEALSLLLLLASGVVLIVSTVAAGGAIAFRMRTVSRERTRASRFGEWQTALHGFLYDRSGSERLQPTVDRGATTDFLNFLLLYVRRLEGEERDEIRRLAEPHLSPILEQLQSRSEELRMRVVQTLGELGLPRHADEVIAALDDPSPLVAMVAASTLARTENADYAGEILARLGRFDLWRQDFLAAMLISMGAGATGALRRTLDDDEAPPRVRAVAADALGALNDPLSGDVAARVLGAEVDVELRAASLRLLASVGREDHLPVVRTSLSATE